MPFPTKDRTRPEDLSAAQRLNGWKEVAAYLARGERTVKRWESDRGLPIHRIPGGGRAAVHASKAELDEWLRSTRVADLEHAETLAENLDGIHDGNGTADPLPKPLLLGGFASATPAGTTAARFSGRAMWLIVTGALLLGLALLPALQSYRTRHRVVRASSAPVSDGERVLARDLYLRGRFEWNKRTPASLNRALDDFTQSIVHDPTSALTYAGLADTYILLREYSLMPESEAYSRAIAAATKAVELDDSVAEAHRSLAFAEIWGRLDFRSAEREFRRAIALDPRDPLTHLWYATAFKAPSWYAITSREFTLAQELDPTSAVILANKSIWLFETGQQEAGVELAQQVERAEPDFVAPHRYLAEMYWLLRKYPEFLMESEKTADLMHDPVLKKTTAAARAGFQKNGARGLLDALYVARKTEYEAGRLPGSSVAEVCVPLGRQDEALQVLRYDFDHHRPGLLAILTDPDLRTMANNPQYQQLIGRLNYPDPPAIDQ